LTINNFNILFYTLAFVIPGFIIDSIYRNFVPKKEDQGQLAILKFLWYSSLNYGVWLWLIYYLYKINFYMDYIFLSAILWFIITFISPVALGLMLSFLNNKNIIRNILQRLGINPIHTIPTAWDYIFSKSLHELWVTVYLEDGTNIHGSFSSNSFASSVSSEKDIFLEKIYTLDEKTGDWDEIPHSNGIWIKGSNIKLIEFIKGGEDNHGQEN